MSEKEKDIEKAPLEEEEIIEESPDGQLDAIEEDDTIRKGPMPQPPAKKKKGESDAKKYIDGIIAETKHVTWPGRDEVLKWALIVLAAISFFALFTFLIDNFIASPIIYGVSGLAAGEGFGRKAIALTVLFFASGLGTAAGVMLHSGGDQNGLSETLSTNLTGGSAVAEKNLDRITIVLGILFALTVAAMMIWFPIGTIQTGA